MFDNITPLQWFLYSVSITVAFLMGLGVRAIWEMFRDAVVKLFK